MLKQNEHKITLKKLMRNTFQADYQSELCILNFHLLSPVVRNSETFGTQIYFEYMSECWYNNYIKNAHKFTYGRTQSERGEISKSVKVLLDYA